MPRNLIESYSTLLSELEQFISSAIQKELAQEDIAKFWDLALELKQKLTRLNLSRKKDDLEIKMQDIKSIQFDVKKFSYQPETFTKKVTQCYEDTCTLRSDLSTSILQLIYNLKAMNDPSYLDLAKVPQETLSIFQYIFKADEVRNPISNTSLKELFTKIKESQLFEASTLGLQLNNIQKDNYNLLVEIAEKRIELLSKSDDTSPVLTNEMKKIITFKDRYGRNPFKKKTSPRETTFLKSVVAPSSSDRKRSLSDPIRNIPAGQRSVLPVALEKNNEPSSSQLEQSTEKVVTTTTGSMKKRLPLPNSLTCLIYNLKAMSDPDCFDYTKIPAQMVATLKEVLKTENLFDTISKTPFKELIKKINESHETNTLIEQLTDIQIDYEFFLIQVEEAITSLSPRKYAKSHDSEDEDYEVRLSSNGQKIICTHRNAASRLATSEKIPPTSASKLPLSAPKAATLVPFTSSDPLLSTPPKNYLASFQNLKLGEKIVLPPITEETTASAVNSTEIVINRNNKRKQ